MMLIKPLLVERLVIMIINIFDGIFVEKLNLYNNLLMIIFIFEVWKLFLKIKIFAILKCLNIGLLQGHFETIVFKWYK